MNEFYTKNGKNFAKIMNKCFSLLFVINLSEFAHIKKIV